MESNSQIKQGDHFTIGPSAIRAFRNWPDMFEENERIASDPWLSWHKITGEKISSPAPLQFQPPKGSSDEGHEDRPKRMYRHSRPKFHEMLSRQAGKVGIHVQYGKRVVEYYEDPAAGKAGVTLENGETIEADVVLAADGIGSKSTKVTMGREVPARPTGFAIYRAALPVELAMVDPMVRDRFQLIEDGHSVAELWMG
jgi:2-polyprenyl-6-methoxyphenol hydroxylase-like FAD-dependent oxidoreductase